jgi:hypothetical protein
MMQNCLGSQIGRNIQVYIDDVVITTREEQSLINNLAETFDNLSRYKLKLNPTKCSFGVSACNAPPFTKGRTPVYLCHSLDQ